MRRRWLPRFPNYDHSHLVEEVTSEITEDEFFERFVSRHRPCVVRGGAKSWPAVGKWSAGTLRSAMGDVSVGAWGGYAHEPVAGYSLDTYLLGNRATAKMTFADFLDQAASDEHPCLLLFSEPFSSFRAVAGDLAGFDFLDLEKHRARTYGDRLFLGRSGYTDWHTHICDETLTVQVCGPKEFLMLPPDSQTWKAMMPVARRGVWRTPSLYWSAEFSRLVPWRATLDPGDVIYIPMHWWHAAEGTDDQLNVTVAKTFRTPLEWLSDFRLPNVRMVFFANPALGALNSIVFMSLRPLVRELRTALVTIAGIPRALARRNKIEW
jgi:hypothetical protein